jgi:hypothetical protein
MSLRCLTVALMASSLAFANLSYAETTVKGSKSNSSDRMGGGGGKGAAQLNPQPEPPGRR